MAGRVGGDGVGRAKTDEFAGELATPTFVVDRVNRLIEPDLFDMNVVFEKTEETWFWMELNAVNLRVSNKPSRWRFGVCR